MHVFNPDTGQYEPLDFSSFIAELKRRSQVIQKTESVEEAFVAGGDFQDMAEAHQRGKKGDEQNKQAEHGVEAACLV